ncbi:3-deoxy-7-phosphoheptulonate synthase [Pigmentibacter sp. JX0631]|uniref:3-deoxy-7-phosphoheptulonate synthase n=1 Tax=Pigmentibacter sp. JX0631 TaxID=2976982 RepID=UPI0024688BFD|nr:3-deoxy-7-phosphoheptulonate synthase [Pigmentibacter sp. JX0631]WGL59668.1 3-deoxy-7-phosphoheptulonate synthase [Pigmentibacter sp. JX0631]
MTSINNENFYFPNWHPESWKLCFQKQIPYYKNELSLKESMNYLKNSEKIVFDEDIMYLKNLYSEAEKGNIFILQAGDCAETFESCNLDDVKNRISHLEYLCNILEENLKKKVVLIGRIAGQYAKPRTEQFEFKNNSKILSYRGDIINSIHYSEIERSPDPKRLIIAYEKAKQTAEWINRIKKCNIFYSHEALLLHYESSLTHYSNFANEWFNYSAHTLWLGERTREINGAHVEFLKGIGNHIGIKIGPNAKATEVVELLRILNPRNCPGKISLITRFGDSPALENLLEIIFAIKKQQLNVTWISDPMHGNSYKSESGYKTRNFNNILNELKNTIEIHKKINSNLAGIHLELTYKDVTECTGGECNLQEQDLHLNYETYCDPRLNRAQSIQLIKEFCSIFYSN